MDIEAQLRIALKKSDPGPDFTQAVLRRAAQNSRRKPSPAPRRAWRVPASLAACALVGLVGLQVHRHLEQKAQAEQAREQLVLALTIVSNELNQLQQKISPN